MNRIPKASFQDACFFLCLVCLWAIAGSIQPSMAQQRASSGISESKITSLQDELDEQASRRGSSASKRRALKNIARDGASLIRSSPTASNRFRVLQIMLQSQKRLVVLENSSRNREALFETCEMLMQAPDAYAVLRLEADLLLSERDLSLKNANVQERTEALAELLGRYRDTPGEAKSLMLASQIAPKLDAFDLERRILQTMQDRFADHHGVIEFRRKSLSAGRIEALFRGTYERVDGTSLTFPIDRMGHLSIIVFWSRNTQGFDVALKQINEHHDLFPGRFQIFSFNLDELPDAGQATLTDLGLDWTVMRLPGGRSSQAYRTYGVRDPVSILVNAYGFALLTPTDNYTRGSDGKMHPYRANDVRVMDPRYLAQLQSLFIGDFLVWEADDSARQSNDFNATDRIPAQMLESIYSCFTPAPFRYRLTDAQSLSNYRKAERLCGEAIAKYPKAANLWIVRNRRIVALLGMWKLSMSPDYLQQAVTEATTALGTPLPNGADIVPRFCLAKAALRSADVGAKTILSGYFDSVGEGDTKALALAAAAILAMDASSIELHNHYRNLLLESGHDSPKLWPVLTFLRDRHHTLDQMKVKLARPERRIRAVYGDVVWPRAHLINHGYEPMTRQLPKLEFETLDGKPLILPNSGGDELTLLMFVEPPVDPDADFPQKIGGTRPEGKRLGTSGVMQYAFERQELHIHRQVKVIAAFLTDDTDRVAAMMKRNEWPCEAAVVPGGLTNPMVRKLGILSADRIPNVFLIRRDGTIAWSVSGFDCKSDFGYPFAIRLAMKVHIEVCDTELGYKALVAGDYEKAKQAFAGPFLLEKDERYGWRAPRFHGRAIANVALKDWQAALTDIDIAIESHRKGSKHAAERPCEAMIRMQLLRAQILDNLGRTDQAKAARESAATERGEYPVSPYSLFHERLQRVGRE